MKELDWEYIDALMPRRAAESSKNDYGRILCVCGSAGYTGAAFFAAQGAVRMGSGVVTLAVPERAWPVLAVKLSEPVVRPLSCTEDGLFSVRALPRLLELAEHADALLIDDVQYFQGKSATVNIVFQLFNRLTDAGKQVVLSADRSPKSIDIDERYKSRFNSGGTYDIQPPEVETKLGIIKSFIEEYKRSEGSWDLYVPEDIQMYIAEISSSNVRELKSAVTKVISQMTAFGNPDITLSDVKSLLENHFSAGALKKITVEAVQHEVEQYYQVSHADLIGTKRSRNIAYARHVAIYLCRQMIDIPYNDIGKRFNRDHSTIMSSVEKIEKKTKESRELQEELEIIIKNIREN